MSTTEPTDEALLSSLTPEQRERCREFLSKLVKSPDGVVPPFTPSPPAPDEDEREALAALIFDHNADAMGSAVRFTSASDRMKRTASEYADLILAAGYRRTPTPDEDEREALAKELMHLSAFQARDSDALADWILARRSPVPLSAKPGRLDPEWRADLVDAATHAINAVWADVPGGVDADTLAQNVVSTQEFFWLSRQFPAPPSAPTPDVDTAALIEEAEGWDAPGLAQHPMSAMDTIRRLAAALRRTPTPKEDNRD